MDTDYFLFDIGMHFFIKLNWMSDFKWLIMYTLAQVAGLLGRTDFGKILGAVYKNLTCLTTHKFKFTFCVCVRVWFCQVSSRISLLLSPLLPLIV